ncbi:hypothetical protein [Bradyrhizobium sp. CB2312]|uniref:hypothetical protein n=1 Tax=Bradyrhizobium sp. CB2312 TaxID=3039155 RepID=UPI0024B202D0|nr:hypothetical protein [Bradyrhizobium sp. CB2312]WFU73819.1 hypothetical protein QA642_07095 [Bradyrhizobium sp. CB2312]
MLKADKLCGRPIREEPSLALLVKRSLFGLYLSKALSQQFLCEGIKMMSQNALEFIDATLKFLALLTHGSPLELGGSLKHSQSPSPRLLTVMEIN